MISKIVKTFVHLNRGKQKIWTEEQEDELRRLFMENQESPQTDQDVIDWIVDNLIETSRTRRGVIKKLKELGLIFKAPTKKSTAAAAANKNLFIKDEDDKLRELYDEHRLDKDCLKRIMEVFDKKRSKKAVVKRMVQLGIIADESEILPARTKKNQREHEAGGSSESSDSDEDVRPTNQSNALRKSTNKYQMNQRQVSELRTELEESLKEAIEWIVESLKEAAEDFDEPSDDIDDAIPIVPFTESQRAAIENSQFQKLLSSINLQAPQELETYWKIPANMMPEDLNKRAKLLSGEEIAEEPVANKNGSDDEEEDEDLFSRLRAQRDALIYNRSDSEDVRSSPAVKAPKKAERVGKPNTKMIHQLLPEVTGEHGEALKWIVNTIKDKAENKTSDAIDELLVVPSTDKHRAALMDESFKKILVAVNLIPPDGIESLWRVPDVLNAKELKNRVELLEVAEDSSDDEDQQMIIKRKRKPQNDGLDINTQELKQRLAKLDDSSDDNLNESIQKSMRNILVSSDEDEAMKTIEKRKSGKRDRSEIGDDTPDENEMNATNNQLKRVRRIADSSDDE